jgi:AraC-like DNA-binding protein
MQRAKSLILETNVPIKKIGLDLGYSETAHFTRAFKKHYGFAPSRLRRAPTID